MQNYDLYKLLDDIKQEQVKMLTLLTNHVKGPSQERIYVIEDLIIYLKTSKRTIATWLQQGILDHSKVGGKIWVTEKQLNSFLEKYSND
jgi:hypothetical protein